MNHTRKTAVFTLLALLSANAVGATQIGYGSTRCSIYGGVQSENGTLGSSIDSWALGYLSGLNHAAMARGETDKLGQKQPGRVLAYIRAYCQSNANQTVEEAASQYWVNIHGR